MKIQERDAKLIGIIQDHIKKYEDGTVWVTSNKGINMRAVWNTVRENYYGIFKKEKDRLGQTKIFYPLTEFMTWENVKNIDVDTKDVNVKGTNKNNFNLATFYRYLIKDWMYRNDFAEQINDDLMYYVLDGHLINKTYLTRKNSKTKIVVKRVDPRNIYIDPHAESLHEAPFVERSVQNYEDIKNKAWKNVSELKPRFDIPSYSDENKENESTNPEVELYEYWGVLSKDLLTLKDSDKDEYVEARVVISNIDESPLVHLIEENKKRKPYEEVRFEKAPNRWAGRGIGEKVLYLQLYLNIIYNTRRVNQLLSQNQLFQFKRGAGITPESLRSLITGGAIEVQNIGDIARIDTRDFNFRQSLEEESNLISVSQRTASTFETASGERLPSSTPATNAIIQQQATKSSFKLRQENYGLLLNKLFKYQIVPLFSKIYKKGDIVRIIDDVSRLKVIKDKGVRFFANEKLVELIQKKGIVPSKEQEEIIRKLISEQLEESKDLFIELNNLFEENELDVEFYVTDESVDKNTLLQNLQYILQNFQALSDPNAQSVLKKMFDILGVDTEGLFPEIPQQQPQQLPQRTATPNVQPSGQKIVGEAGRGI